MPKSLIVDGANENLGLELVARVGVKHSLIAILLISILVKILRERVHIELTERGGILGCSFKGCNLANEALDNMANRHTRRNAVRIHN